MGVRYVCFSLGSPAPVPLVLMDCCQDVYSADISLVQSCLASYETAAGTAYELADAASAVFATLSSLEACTATGAVSIPSVTGAANGTINDLTTGGIPTATVTTGITGATGTAGFVSGGVGRGGSVATGFRGLMLGGLVMGVAVL